MKYLGKKTDNLDIATQSDIQGGGSSSNPYYDLATTCQIPIIASVDTEPYIIEHIIEEDIIPKTGWEQVTAGTDYTNGNMRITANSVYSNSTPVTNAVNDSVSYYWRSANSVSYPNVVIDFGEAKKIKTFKLGYLNLYGGVSENNPFYIQGSNDNSTWDNLYTMTTNETTSGSLVDITLTNTGDYRYYRFYYSKTSTRLYIYEIQVKEYIVYETGYNYIYHLALSTEIPSYVTNMVAIFKTPSNIVDGSVCYLNINSLGDKVINELNSDTYYKIVYNGTQFGILTFTT